MSNGSILTHPLPLRKGSLYSVAASEIAGGYCCKPPTSHTRLGGGSTALSLPIEIFNLFRADKLVPETPFSLTRGRNVSAERLETAGTKYYSRNLSRSTDEFNLHINNGREWVERRRRVERCNRSGAYILR